MTFHLKAAEELAKKVEQEEALENEKWSGVQQKSTMQRQGSSGMPKGQCWAKISKPTFSPFLA